ncbi:MAG: hypothetical protein JHD16_13435 [Solirubrobacteraceae bacterium]|nr:hypothetical protein [Solirubrobacteraceae bacterium]
MTPAGATERVQAQLALADDELCDVLGLTPVQLLSGEGDLLPQTAVLDELLRAAGEQVSAEGIQRWLRASGPAGTPLEHLLAHDYGAFETALDTLLSRGFVVRKKGA